MTTVNTVLGPVDSADLGPTYMHEHIFVTTADVQINYPDEWGTDDARVAEAVSRLKALTAQGIRTIVDPTVVGLGRYLPRIQRVAEQVPDFHIVAATGVYTYHDVPFFFSYRGPPVDDIVGAKVPDPMVDMFVSDIENGIADTGVKAGMLKCAIDDQGINPGVERVLRAVAKAHHRTGIPITVHTHPATETGLVVHRIMCEEEGVQPNRIVLGHSGDSTDIDHLSKLAEFGFVLGMDRFGINVGTTFEARADTLIEMCGRGFADQMVLSHDAACFFDWMDPNVRAAALPQWNYLHIGEEVLPYVRKRGITEEQITTMLVEVPRRLFETAGNH